MDAVREVGITALRGRIGVASTPVGGTTFTISLPVSLAIIDCLEAPWPGKPTFCTWIMWNPARSCLGHGLS